MSVERLHQDRTFVGSAGPRADSTDDSADTQSERHRSGERHHMPAHRYNDASPSAATMTTAQAVMVTPPAARARCCASRVRTQPEDAEPDHGRSEHRNQPGECRSVTGSGSQDEDPGHRNRRRDEQGSAEACSADHLRADLIQHLGYRGLPPRPQSRAGERRLGAAEQPGLRTGGDRSRWPT